MFILYFQKCIVDPELSHGGGGRGGVDDSIMAPHLAWKWSCLVVRLKHSSPGECGADLWGLCNHLRPSPPHSSPNNQQVPCGWAGLPGVTLLLLFCWYLLTEADRRDEEAEVGLLPADITVSHVTAEFGIRLVSGGEVVETEGRQDEAICGTDRRTSAARHRSFHYLNLRRKKALHLLSPCCGRVP